VRSGDEDTLVESTAAGETYTATARRHKQTPASPHAQCPEVPDQIGSTPFLD
jgi:hypothetical protein